MDEIFMLIKVNRKRRIKSTVLRWSTTTRSAHYYMHNKRWATKINESLVFIKTLNKYLAYNLVVQNILFDILWL